RAVLVFETDLPTRFYLRREDVVVPLQPSELVTYCPYKGQAIYWSIDGRGDIAWSYLSPLPEAARLEGLIAFFDDVLEVTVDGVRRDRPNTATAKVMLQEFGVEP
ncbi:MAG TPA: DUF427 domain-containing protein, partial [Dermatophilaceae bacterium]|nr:DUF427 domain-containing protein [Dermatophilaceae bacterium]